MLINVLERIENLKICAKLQSLSLQGNHIDYISNLEFCSQLWRVDLSNNKVGEKLWKRVKPYKSCKEN